MYVRRHSAFRLMRRFIAQRVIAFAGNGFKFFKIDNFDYAAGIDDRARVLLLDRDERNRRAPYSQHF